MEIDENQTKVVSNSSPLINFAIIEQLHLLEAFFGEILITNAVWHECVVEGHGKLGAKTIENAKFLKLIQPQNYDLIRLLCRDLDIGESETIALAIETQADMLLLDEKDARNVASIYGLKTTGVIGILLRAKSENLIDSMKEYLDRLKNDAGLWLDEAFYQKILEIANE
ncbi:TPA: DUF3368 domain-containing protein [bacterium]|nr:DUF3368 domain-containing protein [bacterium]